VKEVDNILRCPRCGGRDVRYSQHQGILDTLMLAFHRVPHRCRSCKHRFYIYLSQVATEEDPVSDQNTPAGPSETR
jgi:DNA-directed RNA polymerase subunit RPC12/RpoP